jgi:hypothetical protein
MTLISLHRDLIEHIDRVKKKYFIPVPVEASCCYQKRKLNLHYLCSTKKPS